MLGSSPESGILRTRSQWNVRISAALYDVTSCIWVVSKPALLASPESTDPPPLVPAFEFQRTCVPPEEELLVDSCFDDGDEEVVRYETVDEPERLDAGDVGER